MIWEIATEVLRGVIALLLILVVNAAVCDKRSWKGPQAFAVIGVVLVGTTGVVLGMAWI